MPDGGLKDSGLGKEGPNYAIKEMTETKAIVIHLLHPKFARSKVPLSGVAKFTNCIATGGSQRLS